MYQKMIDPLPTIDHREIDYERFNKNFYIEHEEIAALTSDKVDELRKKLDIRVSTCQDWHGHWLIFAYNVVQLLQSSTYRSARQVLETFNVFYIISASLWSHQVSGIDPPKPVCSFAHFSFGEELTKAIRKAEYTEPTPIQAQGVPAALSGRDIIGIAKTGSGKTAAFLWPLLMHIVDQKNIQIGDGPIGLICAPTRELSQQVRTGFVNMFCIGTDKPVSRTYFVLNLVVMLYVQDVVSLCFGLLV